MLASKYSVRVADATHAYGRATLAATAEPLIVVTSAMDATTPVFAHPGSPRLQMRRARPHL